MIPSGLAFASFRWSSALGESKFSFQVFFFGFESSTRSQTLGYHHGSNVALLHTLSKRFVVRQDFGMHVCSFILPILPTPRYPGDRRGGLRHNSSDVNYPHKYANGFRDALRTNAMESVLVSCNQLQQSFGSGFRDLVSSSHCGYVY
jgi:hypothetical protein